MLGFVFKYTPVIQSTLCMIFLMYERTVQHLNYSGQIFFNFFKKFAVYVSDTPVTLEQGQGHETWWKLVDPKQGNNNAKFEKPYLNSVREKVNDKSGNMSIISFEYVLKSKIVVYS